MFSWVDRLGDIGSGFVKAAWEAPMLAVDIARAPFSEDEYEGLWGTLSGATIDRGSVILENTIGPDKGLGAAIGGLPEPLRDAGNSVLGAMEWSYKEGVSQPLATLMTMGSIADSEGWSVFSDGDRWKQAYKIAETRSIGQAIVLAYGTQNILDEREVLKYQNTDNYWWTTGLIDAVFAIRLDPTAILGKGIMGARAGGTGLLEQSLSRGGAFARGRVQTALHGTAEEASLAAGLKMTMGTTEQGKVDAFINTLRRVADETDVKLVEGEGYRNVFRLYLESNRETQKALRTQLRAVGNPRAITDGASPVGQIETYLASHRHLDVDTAFKALKNDLGDSTADLQEYTTRIRSTLLNADKSVGEIGRASEILARSYMKYPDDAALHEKTWRALLGDRGAVVDLHDELQGILKIKKTLNEDGERVALLELIKSQTIGSTVKSGVSEVELNQQVFDFILMNEDVYPSEVLADLVENAMVFGDEALAQSIVSISEDVSWLGRLDDMSLGPRGGKPRGKALTQYNRQRKELINSSGNRLTRFVEDARLSNGEPITGPGWNEARLDAMMELNGRRELLETFFIPKARSAVDFDNLTGNVPTLRNVPRVNKFTEARIKDAVDKEGGAVGRAVQKVVDSPTSQKVAAVTGTERFRRSYSATLQSDPSIKPYRLFTNMTPHRQIDLMDDKSDVQIQRMFDSVRMPKMMSQQIRGEYMMANNLNDRFRAFEKAEAEIFAHIADRHGLAPDDVRLILNRVKVAKHTAYRKLEKKNLRFDEDLNTHFLRGENPDEFFEYPVLATEKSRTVAVPDFRDLDRQVRLRANRIQRFTKEIDSIKAVDLTPYEMKQARILAVEDAIRQSDDTIARNYVRHTVGGFNQIQKVWSPAQLLRIAWPLKILTDERVRQFIKFNGIVNWMDQLIEGRNSFHNFYRDLASTSTPSLRLLGIDKELRTGAAMTRSAGIGALFGGAVAGPIGAAAGATVGGALNGNMARKMRQIDGGLSPLSKTANGTALHHAFGNPLDDADIFRSKVSIGQSSMMRAIRGRVDDEEMAMRNFRTSGNYVSVSPKNQTEWDNAFRSTVNRVLGQDQAVQRVLGSVVEKIDNGLDVDLMQDEIADELFTWLTKTHEGKRYASNLPLHSYSEAALERWAGSITDMSYRYTRVDGRMGGVPGKPRDTTLLKKLIDPSQGPVTPNEWRGQFEDLNTMPVIHGAEITETLEQGMSLKISEGIEKAFNLLGRAPSDALSRQPMFNHLYRLEMKRLLNSHIDDLGRSAIDETNLVQIERRAREYALTETRQVMYELAEASEFGELSRMIFPFFSAWQEAITRYSGLAYENPATVARFVSGFEAFSQGEEGEHYIQFRLPEWAGDLANESWFFKGAFENNSEIKLGLDSLNMIASGLPGTGPIVQYPLSRAAAANPGLEQTLSFLFPYGPPESMVDGFLPAWSRRAKSLAMGDDDRAFASQLRRNLKTKIARMENGEIPWVDMTDPVQKRAFLEETEEETKSLMAVRMFSSFVSPATITYDSPYQMFIEGYRELQESGSEDPDMEFLELYGQDFFALTTATTRTVNGVPPTMHGIQMEDKYQDLITTHPELGGVIIGSDGGGTFGQFIRSKYLSQIEEGERQLLSLDEMATAHTLKLGWIEYSRNMDWIEYQKNERGLPNLRVKEAQDLAEMKKSMVASLASKNPAWANDFYSVDRGKWDRRIAGLEDIANTPGLGTPDEKGLTRMDLEPLGEYLAMRKQVLNELQARKESGGSSALDSAANLDISEAWDQFTNNLVERNNAFGDLFYRYLDNDPMRASLSGISPFQSTFFTGA